MSEARQALVLLGGLVATFAVAGLIASPFDVDVGAGHPVFHFLVAVGLAATLAFLRRTPAVSRLAAVPRRAAAVLVVAQAVEAIAAIPNPEGDGTPHAVPNVLSLMLLPVLMVSAIVVLLVALIRRPAAD